MKKYLKCKKIETAIKRAKNNLIMKAQKTGLYENFGDNECREIQDAFIDSSSYSDEMKARRLALEKFYKWCYNYSP